MIMPTRTFDNTNNYLARSVDDRPSLVYVDTVERCYAAVKPERGISAAPLWVPVSLLYEYESELHEQLDQAYSRGDVQRLRGLWAMARQARLTP